MNITIVGGGFGGVKAALELAKDKKNNVTLISDKPDFQYYPTLYNVVTGHSHEQAWIPLSKIFKKVKNVTVTLDRVETIDTQAKKLTGASGNVYTYGKCIMSLGSVTTYFGIEGLDTYSYGVKSAEEIRRLKQHLHTAFATTHEADKHYVVIGAGPTGVELSAALCSYLRQLSKHYGVKGNIHIDLVEAAPRVLPKMNPKVSERVAKRLKALGVHVQVDKAVESETVDTLMVSGQPIMSHTVIWTSGVANSPFYKANESQFNLAPRDRVTVDQHLRAAEDVYVIGDNAATPFAGLAQTALRDAIFVAKNLKREARGQRMKEYKAVMPPVVVPVGGAWAAFEWKGLRLYGWIGDLLRHAADLVGYHDIMPLGMALATWRATFMKEPGFPGPTSDSTSKSPR